MDKLKMQTPDMADENFKKLAALFPNTVTETVDESGVVVRVIDKDMLRKQVFFVLQVTLKRRDFSEKTLLHCPISHCRIWCSYWNMMDKMAAYHTKLL